MPRPLIAILLLTMLCAAGVIASENTGEITPKQPLRIAAFYSSTCNNCHKAKKALAEAGEIFGQQIVLEHHDVANEDEFVLMFDYEDHYDGQEQAPPKVYVGTQCLEGYPEIAEKLQTVIQQELANNSITFNPAYVDAVNNSDISPQAQQSASERLSAKLENFSAGAVAIAGLIDGVNPCAFTTIVFLISMLTHLGKSKRELAIVGAGFTVAVFVTYMLLGIGALGLLSAIKEYSVTSGLAQFIAAAVGILALGFGVWSLIDYIKLKRTGSAAAMTLGLPHSLRIKINKVIRRGLSAKSLAVGSVIVGILVALLESACTGQIYLPTIVLVLQSDKMRPEALGYLLLYNVMFIAPLALVLAVAYKGVNSQHLGKLVQRHLGLAKLTLAALFITLGILVLAAM